MKNKFSLVWIAAFFLVVASCSEKEPVASAPDLEIKPTDANADYVEIQSAGQELAKVTLPVDGFGVSVAVDCNGVVYYTGQEPNLYVMDKDGNLLNTLPTVDENGQAIRIDEMSWDNTNNLLWGQKHGSNPVEVYTIDRTTGEVTFQFTSQTISVGTYRDGIAYDGSDNTLWLSGDVSTTIEHYEIDGTFINAITPKNSSGNELGLISGLTVGVGDLLYLGRNGAVEIVQVKKSNGEYISSFASPGGARDEGLECDPVNFAPALVLWSRDINGFMSIIEVEEGTCSCGGGGNNELGVDVDIKPTSCPNPLNTKSGGVLPVAILGSDQLDVSEIDPSKIVLEGISPLRWAMEDVSTPVGDTEDQCECNTESADGFVDLSLKFDHKSIVAVLGDLAYGEIRELSLSGTLKDGTPFTGADCMVVVTK